MRKFANFIVRNKSKGLEGSKEPEFSLVLKTRMTRQEANRVLEINQENLDRNGGQLHYEGILSHTYALLAKFRGEVVGYTLLEEDFIFNGDIYAMQVAIDNRFKHIGLGSKMYEYAYNHAKGYKIFTASVNPDNIVSQKFHEKNGFEVAGENNLGLLYARLVKKDALEKFEDGDEVKFDIDGFSLSQAGTEPGDE